MYLQLEETWSMAAEGAGVGAQEVPDEASAGKREAADRERMQRETGAAGRGGAAGSAPFGDMDMGDEQQGVGTASGPRGSGGQVSRRSWGC